MHSKPGIFSIFNLQLSKKPMLRDFLNLFTDQSCPGCGQALTLQEKEVCFSCLAQIEETQFHLKPADNDAFFRFAGKVPVLGVATLFYYDKGGRLQGILEHLKYKNAPRLGRFLGEHYAHRLLESDFLKGIEAVAPVPLHWRKLATRGYNQAEEIARGIGAVAGIPVEKGLVKRTRFTTTQTKKGKAERWTNVSGAFVATENLPRSILFVDDVLTTGATLEACVRAMLETENPPSHIKIAGVALARLA